MIRNISSKIDWSWVTVIIVTVVAITVGFLMDWKVAKADEYTGNSPAATMKRFYERLGVSVEGELKTPKEKEDERQRQANRRSEMDEGSREQKTKDPGGEVSGEVSQL